MVGPPPEMDMDKMRKLQEMKQQEDEFDKHLAQTVPVRNFTTNSAQKIMIHISGTFGIGGVT